jgi:predicted O-methyltransferase YrrM
MEQLSILNKHDELNALLSGDKGSTTGINDIEVKHLSWLGLNIPMGGCIVEIGSHRGKSICVMASAAKEAGNNTAKIYAIDLWTKGVGKTFAHYSSEETWQIFQDQVAQMGLSDFVIPKMISSLKAASRRTKPIDLLFIDASHKFANVLADYTAWFGFIPSGGHIAFHDYHTRQVGVTKVIDEIVIPSGLWKDYHTYGRIWSATRK